MRAACTDPRAHRGLPADGTTQGFAAVTRTGLEMLVGQQAVVNLQMAPSALQSQ